jgi:ribosome-associated translation inhibitor RaiA
MIAAGVRRASTREAVRGCEVAIGASMQREPRIMSRDFELTPAIEDQIRERIASLEQFWDRITGCEVTLEAPAVHHHRKGGPFVVRIRMLVPGGELEVNRRAASDFAVAVREAFSAARRRIEDHVRELRHEIKAHPARLPAED